MKLPKRQGMTIIACVESENKMRVRLCVEQYGVFLNFVHNIKTGSDHNIVIFSSRQNAVRYFGNTLTNFHVHRMQAVLRSTNNYPDGKINIFESLSSESICELYWKQFEDPNRGKTLEDVFEI